VYNIPKANTQIILLQDVCCPIAASPTTKSMAIWCHLTAKYTI